jgi:hypothetical protein
MRSCVGPAAVLPSAARQCRADTAGCMRSFLLLCGQGPEGQAYAEIGDYGGNRRGSADRRGGQ